MARTQNSQYLSIHAASKACGLTPSVLRIWELRYGWPNPNRRPNGYRAYSKHLIEDLKRVAEMVKSGTPISEIIIDGMPEFPKEPETVDAPRRLVEYTRTLQRPAHPGANRLRESMENVLEKRNGGAMQEIFQRANWELRPQEENLAVLLPAVIGLLEQRVEDRETPQNEIQILDHVERRAQQLQQRFPVQGDPIWLHGSRNIEPALFQVIALGLRQRGVDARIWNERGKPGEGQRGALVKVQSAGKRRPFGIQVDGHNLRDLLAEDQQVPWNNTAAA